MTANHSLYSMSHIQIGLIWLALTLVGFSAAADSLKVSSVEDRAKAAALRGDWQEVWAISSQFDGTSKSVPLRMLMAHAALATNKNNEAVCVLLNVIREDGASDGILFNEWRRWAEEVAKANAGRSIALYLAGDAAARHADWKAALTYFDAALGLDPQNAIVLNAHGVANIGAGDPVSAIVDFERAIRANPGFAEAYASYGTLNVMRRMGAEIALARFERVLNISPGYTLGLNGRGCAYYALGKWEEARRDFEDALSESTCNTLGFFNLGGLLRAQVETLEAADRELAAANPGMQIKLLEIGKDITLLRAGIAGDMALQNFYGMAKDANLKVDAKLSIGKKMQLEGHVGISIAPDWSGMHKTIKDYTEPRMMAKYSEVQRLQTQLLQVRNEGGPGGVTMDMRRAHVDTGNWPVDTTFGLLYLLELEGLPARSPE
jgi:tetratricopeptide (TPR) repeat protein